MSVVTDRETVNFCMFSWFWGRPATDVVTVEDEYSGRGAPRRGCALGTRRDPPQKHLDLYLPAKSTHQSSVVRAPRSPHPGTTRQAIVCHSRINNDGIMTTNTGPRAADCFITLHAPPAPDSTGVLRDQHSSGRIIAVQAALVYYFIVLHL